MEDMMADIMRTRIGQLEDENRALAQELSDKTGKLRDAAAAAEAVRTDAHQVIGQWAEDAKKSRLHCEELMRAKSDVAQTLLMAEGRVQELTTLNVSQASRIQRLEKDLEDAAATQAVALSRASAAALHHADDLQARDAEIATLRSENQRLRLVSEAADAEGRKWEADCMDALALVQSLRQERLASAAREADLSNLLCVAEGTAASLAEQLAAAQNELKAAKEMEAKMSKMSATAEEHVVLLAEAEEKEAALHRQLQRVNDEIARYEQRVVSLTDECRAHDVAAEALLQENSSLKGQLLEAATQLGQLQGSGSHLREKLSAAEQNIADLSAMHAAAVKRSDDFESDVAEHLDTIESQKRVLQTLNDETERLRGEGRAALKSTESLQTEVDAVRAEFNRSHAENIALKAKAAAAAALETELRATVDALRSELRGAVSKAESNQRAADAKHAAERLDAERHLSASLAAAAAEKGALAGELEELRNRLQESQSTGQQSIASLTIEVAQLKAADSSRSAEIGLLRDACHTLEAECERLRTELQRKARDANDSREQQRMAEHMLSQAVLDHQDERDRWAVAQEALHVELQALRRAVEAAQEKMDASDGELLDARTELHRLRHALIAKDDALQRSDYERETLAERTRNVERLLAVQKAATGELEAKAQTADALRTEMRALQQDNAVLESRLQQAQDNHERSAAAQNQAHERLETEIKVRAEQHAKLKAVFDEAKGRCAAAEESAAKSEEELNAVIRNRDEIITKYNCLHDRYSLLKRQVQDGGQHASTSATAPLDSDRRKQQLEVSLATVTRVCREQEGQLEALRHEHRLLQRAMNMMRTTTATVEEFHKSCGLSVQNLNTLEGPRRHPRKRSQSQHSDAHRPAHRAEGQIQASTTVTHH